MNRYRFDYQGPEPTGGSSPRTATYTAEDTTAAIALLAHNERRWPYWIGGVGYISSHARLINVTDTDVRQRASPLPTHGGILLDVELELDGEERRTFEVELSRPDRGGEGSPYGQ